MVCTVLCHGCHNQNHNMACTGPLAESYLLCRVKYYNNCLFHNVQRNFIVQTGDPTGTGKGGTSVYGCVRGQCGCMRGSVGACGAVWVSWARGQWKSTPLKIGYIRLA